MDKRHSPRVEEELYTLNLQLFYRSNLYESLNDAERYELEKTILRRIGARNE